jgi:DNA invertase Pin-like site-specific DNA recombinase
MSTATGMTFGYARISTTQQDEALQPDALTHVGCTRIYTDTASGATQSRPALDELLEHLRPGHDRRLAVGPARTILTSPR